MRFENVRIYDLEESIKASKYPMAIDTDKCNENITKTSIMLGSSGKGEGHDQYLTGIRVAFDLTFTNKAWVEMERYHFVDFVSSQSTMHRITKFDLNQSYNKYVDTRIIRIMKEKVDAYNLLLELSKDENFFNDNDYNIENKEDLDDVLKLMYLEVLYSNPSGFELTARLTTNYRALKTIYSQRKNHRLPEWRELCEWIKELPYFKELCLGETD